MIGRSTQPIAEIAEIMKITDTAGIVSSNPQIIRGKDHFITQSTQRSGARSIVPQDTIWKSPKLFWTARRCHHRWHKNQVKANIAELILTIRIR